MQILGGGFNCQPPVDKVPVTDYLLCQNMRADSLGKLTGRAGYQTIFTVAGAGIAHSCFNAGGTGDPYYVGTNSDVTGTITSALYYDNNPTPIATGFDGRRIGFAAQNGATWVMNRGNQGRHDPVGGWQNYQFPPPPKPPSASTTATPTALTTFTYTFALTGDPNYLHYITINGVQYGTPEYVNGWYSIDQITYLIAFFAAGDPNCSVTSSGNTLVLTPIVPNTIVNVTGSDGNDDVMLSPNPGGITSLPNGTYRYYLTYLSADGSIESNPTGASVPAVTTGGQSIALTFPTDDYSPPPADSRITSVNVYRNGGTLSNTYLLKNIALSDLHLGFIDSVPDTQLSTTGVVLPTQNDAPPAASGIIGPYYGRLVAWSTASNKNRLFWTNAEQPQYWPGANDPAVGNWVDVGLDDEEIIWCSIHTNLLVIYKERTIWLQIGDFPSAALPSAGTLEQEYDGIGLAGQWALAPAGQIDYFVGPNGLYLNDMSQVHEITGNVLPIFNQNLTNDGTSRTPPGSVLPGTAFNPSSTDVYAVALGHAMGRLYIAYAEQSTPNDWVMLVQDEGSEPETQAYFTRRSGRWFYHRNQVAHTLGFFGFFFDGNNMIGLTGAPGQAAQGLSVADFRGFATQDPGPVQIEYVYQSHYEDAGLPDNDKLWLEVAIDCEVASGVAGTGANVYVLYNNGLISFPTWLGVLPEGEPRQTVTFPLALPTSGLPESMDDGFLARNCSIQIDCISIGAFTLHNVYLYYYVEARVGQVASTIPTDLGIGKIKECKEVQLDINAYGPAAVAIVSDLPGNALATRETIPIAQSTGRGIIKYPFGIQEGLLWQVALEGGPFRLYGARLLMRVIGVYVEGYEAVDGFQWDSQEIPLGAGDAFTLDALRFDMQALGASSVEVLTDLPGECFASRGVYALTTGSMRRGAPLQITGAPRTPTVYVRGTALGALTTTAGGTITLAFPPSAVAGDYAVILATQGADTPSGWDAIANNNGGGVTAVTGFARTLTSADISAGHVNVVILSGLLLGAACLIVVSNVTPLPVPSGPLPGSVDTPGVCELSTTSEYGATSPYGFPTLFGGAFPAGAQAFYFASCSHGPGTCSVDRGTALHNDTGTQSALNQEVLMSSDTPIPSFTFNATVSNTANAATLIFTPAADVPEGPTWGDSCATGRHWVTVPLPPGIEARSVRVQIVSSSSYRIYAAQVRAGHTGRYMALLPPDGREDAFNVSIEFDFRSEKRKMFKRLEIDMRADGNVSLAVITDQDGAPITTLFSQSLSTPDGREAIMVPLPPGIRGRLFRVQLGGPAAARVYNIRVLTRAVSEPAAAWVWEDFPLEASDVLPTWHDLVSVEETSPVWTLVDVPFEVTNG